MAEPLGWAQWAVCLALASAVLWVEEVRKGVLRARARRGAGRFTAAGRRMPVRTGGVRLPNRAL